MAIWRKAPPEARAERALLIQDQCWFPYHLTQRLLEESSEDEHSDHPPETPLGPEQTPLEFFGDRSPRLPIMADRFPTIEDLTHEEDDMHNQGPTTSDAAGSFLDRERAVLGDDANQFSTPQDSAPTAPTVEDNSGNLLGDDDFEEPERATSSNQGNMSFENSFPAIDTQNEAVGPGGAITGTQAGHGYTGYSAPVEREEPEPVRQWREKRDADLAKREAASAKKRDETRAQAQKDLDAFYVNYNNKTDKGREATKRDAEQFLKNRQDTTSGGTSWERVAKLVDLSGKGQSGGAEGSSKAKMRSMLLDLKGDEKAPGA